MSYVCYMRYVNDMSYELCKLDQLSKLHELCM